ncbi:MAG: M23 family metallopeptidase [Chloroflexi bacterium]|nr:M23 family metallopeptidase [Chloroflexota bacterium]MCC6897100.1 M23 family metallopeptidase [Anaerolineae bacterium]
MHPEKRFYRYLRWLVLSAAVGLVFLLAFAAMYLGSQSDSVRQVSIAALPTLPTVDWTPIAPFAQVDSAIMPYLQYGQFQDGIVPLQVLGEGIVPVGAYLPQSGNAQFSVMTATPSLPPSLTPVATTTLIAVFQPTQTDLPTRMPSPTITPVEVYVATVNAPTAEVIVPTIPVPTVPPGTECSPSGLPISGRLTQRYFIGHMGIDISAPTGTQVVATHSGYVDWAEWNIYGYGNLVVIHSGHFITYYGHNSDFNVKKGDFVNKGQVIAFSGSTGNSSGPHVHYETRINDVTVDPLTFEVRGFRSC